MSEARASSTRLLGADPALLADEGSLEVQFQRSVDQAVVGRPGDRQLAAAKLAVAAPVLEVLAQAA